MRDKRRGRRRELEYPPLQMESSLRRRFEAMMRVFIRLIRAGGAKRFLVHGSPHADEFGAIELLRQFGQRIFGRGVRQAQIEVTGSGGALPEGKTWEQHAREGTLCIGVGHGPFDEHPGNGDLPGFPGECATTLVARALHLAPDGPVGEFIAHVWRTDTRPASSRGIGELVKSLHRFFPADLALVIRLVRQAVGAWLLYPGVRQADGFSLGDCVGAWLRTRKQDFLGFAGGQLHKSWQDWESRHPNKRWGKWEERCERSRALTAATELEVHRFLELEDLLRYFSGYESGYHEEIMELGDLANAIACGRGPVAAQHWVEHILNAKFWDSQRFVDAILEVNSKVADGSCLVSHTECRWGKVKVVAIESGNDRMNAALRSPYGLKADVVVVRQPTGNTQIFTAQKSGVGLDHVVGCVRADEERKLHGAVRSAPEALTRPGMGEEERWYYHRVENVRGSMLLNGSTQSSTDVPATALSLGEVFEAVRRGLEMTN